MIIQPASAYKFRVIPTNAHHPNPEVFTQNVVFCHIDLVNKTVKVDVRQTILPESFEAVINTVRSDKIPVVEVLDYMNEPLFTLVFHHAKLTQHDFNLSYEDGGALVHHLEWSFQNFSRQDRIVEAVAHDLPMWPSPADYMQFVKDWKDGQEASQEAQDGEEASDDASANSAKTSP